MTDIPPVELRTPRLSESEEMMKGNLYDTSDPELDRQRHHASALCERYNALPRDDFAGRAAILDELLSGHGVGIEVAGNISFDYGIHTLIGDRVFINFNFTVLDSNQVTIGDDVMFGPNVSLLPPVHPLRWQDRNIRRREDGTYYNLEYSKPIVIGRNCWFGGGATVVGGVTIGEGCVIGAGSVVTHDIPANSLAVGNPAHVIRTITDEEASVNQQYAR